MKINDVRKMAKRMMKKEQRSVLPRTSVNLAFTVALACDYRMVADDTVIHKPYNIFKHKTGELG